MSESVISPFAIIDNCSVGGTLPYDEFGVPDNLLVLRNCVIWQYGDNKEFMLDWVDSKKVWRRIK